MPTDSDDRPLQDISITGVTIFTNPFKEMREEEAKKEEEEAKKVRACRRELCFRGHVLGAYLCVWAVCMASRTSLHCKHRPAAHAHTSRHSSPKQNPSQRHQAAGGPGADDPDAQRSAWYSNPAASHATAAVRSGVGKYVQDAKLDSKPGVGGRALAAAAAGGGGGEGGGGGGGGGAAAAPAAKKQKTQGFGNFDAW